MSTKKNYRIAKEVRGEILKRIKDCAVAELGLPFEVGLVC
jgi:hypothetical protein